MKILVTGLNGLVGSRIKELLTDYELENISRSTGVDITQKEQIYDAIGGSGAEVVLHLAAKTDVDGCEREKDLAEESEAWKINVIGTKNVAEACLELGKKLIYISTDFVFDGEIGENEFYDEDSLPNPINFYAKTKYEGEKVVKELSSSWIIARLAYPYRANFVKNDFARAIKSRLELGQEVAAITDHIFCPTFIDDVAFALDKLINSEATGIFHVVGSQPLSPFDSASLIANEFGLDSSLIKPATREEFFKDRAKRPFRLALKNDKIQKLGIGMKTFEQGLKEIKNQI